MNALPEEIKGLLMVQFAMGYKGEVDGEYNSYVTGIAVKHPPSPEEKLAHSEIHGGPADFRRRFKAAHPELVLDPPPKPAST